jgi:spermidine/putrescine transport system ATP-binding protein
MRESTESRSESSRREELETPALSLRGVVKRFGEVLAVDHVSFDVGRSEFFSLLGPSGCGKTTTLRMLAGFERLTEGQILIDGRDASHVPPNERDTNMVFQSYALFPHMTVAQNVAFGPQRRRMPRGEIEERVRESLTTVRMEALAGRFPRALSGGQQQRVALARALANRPALLLLDEPLGALDLKLREEMQFELKRIQREVGISFVYVTHDQGEALTMSDRIAVMRAGRVEHLGTPEEIYLRPATPFVAGFIGQASFVPCRIVDKGVGGVEISLPDGSRIRASQAAAGCRAGSDGVLMLRPEHLRLSLDRPVDGVGLEVRVLEEVFQGSVVRYQVEGVGDTRLAVEVPLAQRLEAAYGGSAWVGWNADWAYVLPANDVPDDATVARADEHDEM